MIISVSNLKINASLVQGTASIRVTDRYPIISWVYNVVNRIVTSIPPGEIDSVSQASPDGYEIRIGTSSAHLGFNNFNGDIIQTGFVLTQETSWRYTGSKLQRGHRYYGQIRITDALSNVSNWTPFYFQFNSLPVVTDALISPSEPSITDDLTLTYTYVDTDGDLESGSKIWWYKNGVRQRQFDGQTTVKSKYLSYSDGWSATIIPSDGYEIGAATNSNTVSVLTETPVASNLVIIPSTPTTADPLYAKYDFTSIEDLSNIRWYVNNALISQTGPFLRYPFAVGDSVRFEIQPSDGISTGTYLASPTVTISEQPFYVVDLALSNESLPLQVASTSPTVSWRVIGPIDSIPTKIKVQLGTSAGASNIFLGEIESSDQSYTIPSSLITSGVDYFITISVGNDDGYGEPDTLHFRTQGSRWFENVSNSTGWTIESTFKINTGYQGFRIYDGTKHVELRFYVDKLQIVSVNVTEIAGVFSSFSTISIIGKGNDIFVYQNYSLIADGTGLLLQLTNDKFIEFGSINSVNESSADYLNLYYTTDGNFLPTDSAYTSIAFTTFYEIDGEIDYITSANGEMYFAASAAESGASSVIYKVSDYKAPITASTVCKTFTPVNRISQSPNSKYTYICHGRGATLFSNYAIGNYDSSIDFTHGESPTDQSWEFIENSANISQDVSGLTINTANGGKAYYTQRNHGTKWFDFVSSETGWTVNFTLQVINVNDDNSGSNTESPDGCGVFASDGSYAENIYFLAGGIQFANANKFISYDTSLSTNYTIVGKSGSIRLFAGTLLLAQVPMTAKSTSEGNGRRPQIAEDANGEQHAVWQDDGDGIQSIYYAKTVHGEWAIPEKVVAEKFGSAHPSICITSDNKIFVAYESYQNDLSDIGMVIQNAQGWGRPFDLSHGLGLSQRPKVAVDASDSVHVVWEDYRNGQPQIFYKKFSDGAWSADLQLTGSTYGCFRPSIAIGANIVWVTYTSRQSNGTSKIAMVTYASSWTGEYQISDTFTEADFSDIVVASDGTAYITWHDAVLDTYQIYARRLNSSFFALEIQQQLTEGNIASRYPSIGLRAGADAKTGNVYIVYEKGGDLTPYDYTGEYTDAPSFVTSSIYSVYFDKSVNEWLSDTHSFTLAGDNFGGIDVLMHPNDVRQSRRPAIAKLFASNAHILYETEIAESFDEYLISRYSFTAIRDVSYDLTYETIYSLTVDNDLEVSGRLPRKEIRIGDFSETIGGVYLFKNLQTFTQDAVDPFTITLISKETTPIPDDRTLSVLPNNNGDAWIGTSSGLSFYFRNSNDLAIAGSLSGLVIRCMTIDKNGIMYVGTSTGVIYVSYDHVNFLVLSLTGVTITGDITDLAVDSNNMLWVATHDMGLFQLNTEPVIYSLVNGSTTPPAAVTGIIRYDISTGFPSFAVSRVAIDATDTVWAGTDNGLVRIFKNNVRVFTMANGMPSNRINDIAIVNTGLRYIATSQGLVKMTGSAFDPVEILHPEWNSNVKSVAWKQPNILLAGSLSNLFQIVVGDSYIPFVYPPSSYTLESVGYDDLRTYYIIGVDSTVITENSLFQVFVNNRNIKHGYSISNKDGCWAVTFLAPLAKNDIVEVIIRNDIITYADLQRNKAEQVVFGPANKIVKKFITNGVNLYAMTNDTNNELLRYDYANGFSHPYDKIGLDTTPPTGTLQLDNQIDRHTVQLSIINASDNLSGIDSMKVSNYSNFTSDGTNPLDWVPFQTTFTFDLGTDLGLSVVQLNFDGTGSKICLFGTTLYSCSSAPLNVYSYDNTTESWSLVTTLESGDQATECKFMIVYNNKLIIGTGHASGTGKVYVSIDGTTFNLLASINGEFAYSATILNNTLYIGTGSLGKIYAYDGTHIREVYTGLGSNIYGLSGFNNKLYAATGEQGRLYSWDPVTNVALISDVDTDTQLNSVYATFIQSSSSSSSSSSSGSPSTPSGNNVIFVGTNNSSRIIKSTNKNPFITSFSTINGHSVKFIKPMNDVIYAGVDKTLFYYINGVWLSKQSVTSPIEDVYVDSNDNLWIVTDSYIYATQSDITQKTIYLQLRDKAGNETVPTTTGLSVSVQIQDLINFTNVNRILEVDEYGTTISTYDGDDTFYSADKIITEQGVYLSEIFNGTNDHVSWGQIYWDAIVPSSTSLTISVRTAKTRDQIVTASWTDFTEDQFEGVDISTLSGQFIQFKATLASSVRGISPSLYKVVITSVIQASVHYFTTNFVMPSSVTKGILTATTVIPVSSDIVFGINTNNSVDFSDYQIIEPNKLFVLGADQIGTNLRVGVKLISPTRPTPQTDDYSSTDGYGESLYLNVINFTYTNSGSAGHKNFRVTFFNDFARTDTAAVLNTVTSQEGWSTNGVAFPSSGINMNNGDTASVICSIDGTSALRCNQYYYLTIEVFNGSTYSTFQSNHSFIAGCNTTYVDSLAFDFTNSSGSTKTYQFRMRLYEDAARTTLLKTQFSGSSNAGWTVNSSILPQAGTTMINSATVAIGFLPDISDLTYNTIYYLVLDAYDGTSYTNISQNWTFRSTPISSEYCGEYSDVPILKNFAIMFELNDGEFVMLNT